jgi:hypothetical protein
LSGLDDYAILVEYVGFFTFRGSQPMSRFGFVLMLATIPVATLFVVPHAQAQNFEFAAPPSVQSNYMYRINRKTGEVTACQFVPKNGTVGNTVCMPAGEGAGAQPQGSYHLTSSHLTGENGLYRVNDATGELSVCYPSNGKVVCTAPAR